MPKIKLRQNAWPSKSVTHGGGPKCPYCGSGNTHPLKTIEAGGFQTYRCSDCYKTFGKKV